MKDFAEYEIAYVEGLIKEAASQQLHLTRCAKWIVMLEQDLRDEKFAHEETRKQMQLL